MTRKHFEAIAAAFSAAAGIAEPDWTPEDMRQYLAEEMSSVLAGENERFDRARFLAACGL